MAEYLAFWRAEKLNMTKILVVDDEDSIVDVLEQSLSLAGYDVISAKTGASALVLIYRERPDVVLLDLMIPVVNGYEVVRELRRIPTTKNLPVILLTAVSPEEGEQAAVQLGANDYLTKPWRLSSILAVIENALKEAGNSPSLQRPEG